MSRLGATAAIAVCALLAAASHASSSPPSVTVTAGWSSCPTTRSTAASVLVAADPEWARTGRMHPKAVEGVRRLSEAGADFIRLLNFNIFPGISCAKLEEKGAWDFDLMDGVMEDFMAASGNASVIVDIETSPSWMWKGSNSTTLACANSTSIEAPVGPRTRCPYYGLPTEPRSGDWEEIATYFKRVGDWYTQGGFTDEEGRFRASGHHYKIDRWEILNEVNHPREHDFTPQGYIDFYDTQIRVMTSNGAKAPGAKWLGPSLGGVNPNSAKQWFGPSGILNASMHHPASTPVDGISFHVYAGCHNNTAAGMEYGFTTTDERISSIPVVAQLRDQLRPDAELHLTESGILCNSPRWCDVNNYTCWYRNYSSAYWTASAGQWLYQFLTFAQAADLDSIAQSQILGYPYRFDKLSGEWPCGTMVDWEDTNTGLNAKLWVEVALLESVSRPFSYCEATSSDPSLVYAQTLRSSKGRVLVLINKSHQPVSVRLPAELSGRAALVIDERTENTPARRETVSAGSMELGGFATVIVQDGDP